MQLYSMELGSPPLYAELNRVQRDMDLNFIKELGPFSKAMYEVSSRGESMKNVADRLMQGSDVEGNIQANMGSAFLLWRGTQMKDEWIDAYESNAAMIS